MSELTKYIEDMQLELNELTDELKKYQDLLKLIVGIGVSFFIAAYLAVLVR